MAESICPACNIWKQFCLKRVCSNAAEQIIHKTHPSLGFLKSPLSVITPYFLPLATGDPNSLTEVIFLFECTQSSWSNLVLARSRNSSIFCRHEWVLKAYYQLPVKTHKALMMKTEGLCLLGASQKMLPNIRLTQLQTPSCWRHDWTTKNSVQVTGYTVSILTPALCSQRYKVLILTFITFIKQKQREQNSILYSLHMLPLSAASLSCRGPIGSLLSQAPPPHPWPSILWLM